MVVATIQRSLTNVCFGIALATFVFSFDPTSVVAEETSATPSLPAAATTTTTTDQVVTIEACKKNPDGGSINCISTKNVRQLDLYAAPWTFETSPDEVIARIKGVVAADPYLELTSTESENPFYIKAKATRSIFVDNLEFLVNPVDKVVFFRAQQEGEPSVGDFGAIRKELDSIRQRAKLGVMGQGIMSADSMPSQNGPLGQLKAFYGLQSGQGFEEVFED